MPQSPSSPSPSPLASNLRKIRESYKGKGISQRQLALKLGYKGKDAGAVISRIENNAQEPRYGKLERIARALGVTVQKLLRS